MIPAKEFSLAPMLGHTDALFLLFVRLLSRKTTLYSEMIHMNTILNTDDSILAKYSIVRGPKVIQLAGNDPIKLVKCTKICQKYDLNNINLNIGCPSKRAVMGDFGAILMDKPDLIAACVRRVKQETGVTMSIKCRIGNNEQYSYTQLKQFVDILSTAGVKKFIIHARNAVLGGLSPKKNRQIPKLNYDLVFKLKHDFPELIIIINGGITELSSIHKLMLKTDGIMIGRAALKNTFNIFANVDNTFFKKTYPPLSKETFIKNLANEIKENDLPVKKFLPMLNCLFYNERDAKKFKLLLQKCYNIKDPFSEIQCFLANR